jgi:hypothetical protein
LQTGGARIEARRFPRVLMDVDVNIYSQKNGLAPGRTVDISEGGISAVVPVELFIGETVKMEIRFPLESATVTAVVRSRNVFRYGFEFKPPESGKELTGRELIRRAPERPDSA